MPHSYDTRFAPSSGRVARTYNTRPSKSSAKAAPPPTKSYSNNTCSPSPSGRAPPLPTKSYSSHTRLPSPIGMGAPRRLPSQSGMAPPLPASFVHSAFDSSMEWHLEQEPRSWGPEPEFLKLSSHDFTALHQAATPPVEHDLSAQFRREQEFASYDSPSSPDLPDDDDDEAPNSPYFVHPSLLINKAKSDFIWLGYSPDNEEELSDQEREKRRMSRGELKSFMTAEEIEALKKKPQRHVRFCD